MTEKLALLEERVRVSVAGAHASVEEIVVDVGGIVADVKGTMKDVRGIVENVKGTVEDTIATAQRTFDLPLQMGQHPWPMVGGALLVGYVLGSWGDGHTSAAASTRHAQPARPQPQQGILSDIRDQLKDEMTSLGIVAVRAMMSTLCEMFTPATPSAAPHSAPPEQHAAFVPHAATNGAPS
jgi:hypothetical protein